MIVFIYYQFRFYQVQIFNLQRKSVSFYFVRYWIHDFVLLSIIIFIYIFIAFCFVYFKASTFTSSGADDAVTLQ